MISKAYSDFFSSLEGNNNKEWFNDNKKVYEKEVKIPFLKLVTELIDAIGQWDQRIDLDPKKTLFRINRDIRFSKDKSPYNTIMKAAIAPGGRKSGLPGYYLGISADTIHIGGGQFDLDSATLAKLRNYLAENYDELISILDSADFKKHYSGLQGDKVTRLSGDLKEKAQEMPLLLHKQYYAMEKITDSKKYSDKHLVNAIRSVKPMVALLERGIKS